MFLHPILHASLQHFLTASWFLEVDFFFSVLSTAALLSDLLITHSANCFSTIIVFLWYLYPIYISVACNIAVNLLGDSLFFLIL